jgi:hypothetical protein
MPNHFNKYAAKEKITRKKIVSALEKAKTNYGKLKSSLDNLEAQAEKINSALEKTKSDCSAARKEMMKYHKTIQNMDLSNASDVTFYESGDVGYLINNTECHLDLDDVGDLRVVPMREHRKSKRQKPDTNEAPYTNMSDDASDEDGGDASDQGQEYMDDINLTHDELDNLYASLLRTASDIELEKLSEWAEQSSEDEIVEKISSLLEEMELSSDTSRIEQKIKILEQFLDENQEDELFASDGNGDEDLEDDESDEFESEEEEEEEEEEDDDEEELFEISNFKKRMNSLNKSLNEELMEDDKGHFADEDLKYFDGEEDEEDEDEEDDDSSFEDESEEDKDDDLEELDFEVSRKNRSILDKMEDEEF